jgi:hypothetical protein
MRELQKASSDTTLLAGWSSSTSWPLAHVVRLQAAQRESWCSPPPTGRAITLLPASCEEGTNLPCGGDLLPNPLMGSCSVEVHDIRIQDPLELLFLKNQQMVKAFLPHTPGEALADRISSRRVRGRFEKLDPTGRCNTSKARPKFVIGITYQILWLLSIGRGGFSQLLGHPGIGRRACHSDLDHLP